MKKWNNYLLIICAFLLLMICFLSISGSLNNKQGATNNASNTEISHQND